jgi:hypothetical protein
MIAAPALGATVPGVGRHLLAAPAGADMRALRQNLPVKVRS